MRLSGVGCELEGGVFNVVLGRNGAGKTRLARRLAGLDEPGTVLLDGRPVTHHDAAIVFQEFVNYPSLDARANIASPLRARGLARAALETRVVELARSLRIDDVLERRPAELSGGQQQRVAIARALAKGSAVLVLDEPLGNLDYKLREALVDELKALLAGGERVLVYMTADPHEAMALAEHLVLLHEGRVLQSGAPLELWRHPGTPEAANLLSDPAVNFTRAQTSGTDLVLEGGVRVPAARFAAAGRELLFGVRPEHLRIVPVAQDDWCLPAQATLAETNGSDTFLHVDVGTMPWVAHLDGIHRFDEGAALDLYVAASDVLVFETA